MKAVILAGGLGTRISEETHLKPKPMIEIGGMPIIWHILKIYSTHGINEFIICCGYKGYVIKEFFANYFLHMSDVTFDLAENSMFVHKKKAEPWKITLINTGEDTATGGRLLLASDFIKDEESFCFTYGDGLTDANIQESIKFHHESGKLATVLAIKPPGRYGALAIENNLVDHFLEKPLGDGAYINGGFFVLSPKCLHLIADLLTPWEAYPLTSLAQKHQLAAFKHHGFWQCMDTLRDKFHLDSLWDSGQAPWKSW